MRRRGGKGKGNTEREGEGEGEGERREKERGWKEMDRGRWCEEIANENEGGAAGRVGGGI